MPLTKSAKKALLVSHRRTAENALVKAKVKSALKGARLGIKAKAEDLADKVKLAQRELDLAAKKNVMHKNKAARLKSRLAKAIVKAENEPAAEAKAKKASTKSATKPAAKKTAKTTKKK